jgi:putative phage-type endonuclease
MKEFDVEQGSSEWHDLRKGVITASRMGRILTPKTLKLSAQADDLAAELIGEKLSLIPEEGAENFTNRAMRWGSFCESEARNWYAMERNANVRQIGFCLSDCGRWGASPDGLIDPDGVLELKAPQPNTMVKWLLAGEVPPEHLMQCHGALLTTGRAWIDFLAYCPGIPGLLVRIEPNELTEALRVALEAFYEKYQFALEKVKGMT